MVDAPDRVIARFVSGGDLVLEVIRCGDGSVDFYWSDEPGSAVSLCAGDAERLRLALNREMSRSRSRRVVK